MTIQKTNRLRSTPGMWILFFIFLSIIVAISIYGVNTLLDTWSGKSLPTRVFTIEEDVISLKLPENWNMTSNTTDDGITFTASTGYETLSIAKMPYSSITQASIFFLLELEGMFPGVNVSNISYTQTEIGGKKLYATQIYYGNMYYLCGVRESGNTIIKFVYNASIMAGEISDIDSIINSINYREKK